MRLSIAIALCLLALSAAASELDDALRRVDDGRIEFQFEAREGVCGRGNGISFCGDCDRFDRWDCDEGPVRVLLTIRGGEIQGLKTRIGGRRTLAKESTDLGEIEAAQASEFLMRLARKSDQDDVAEDALQAAVLARDVVVWPELLEIARDRRADDDLRESALFWLGQQAGEKAREGLEQFVELDEEDLDLRETAIFALSQRDESESLPALMRIARGHEVLELRRTALFWLSQHDDPRVVDLFEELLSAN